MSWLPRFMLIKSNANKYLGHAFYTKGSPVRLGEPNVFSTLVKIEVERGTTDDKYINLRFCSSNKYWQKSTDNQFIVAVSSKPQEDTTKPSCTLFEAVELNDSGVFYLNHVQTGGRLSLDHSARALYVENGDHDRYNDYLTSTDWESLVNLPPHVAFKGDNGKYLQVYYRDDYNYLKFNGDDDPNNGLMGNTITLLSDGHIQIKNDHWGLYWRRSPNWIWADSPMSNGDDVLYWPVKVDDTTIALRNEGNMMYCQRLTTEGKESCLNAAASSIVREARLSVEELVNRRKIYNVRYQVEDAMIFGETPYAVGSDVLTNEGDVVATLTGTIGYESSKSSTFSNNLSIMVGVSNTVEAGIPEIASDSITVSAERTFTTEWGTTTTTTTSGSASATVDVPPKSETTITYVATTGKCNVPFTYTQEDRSSVDGTIYKTEKIDGVYIGANLYNFHFVVGEARPIG